MQEIVKDAPLTLAALKSLKPDTIFQEHALIDSVFLDPKYKKRQVPMTKENGHLFRYIDTSAFQDNRVKLPPGTIPDYINASWINGSIPGRPRLIAAQGPVPPSVASFLRMAVFVKSPLIVMLCRVVENGHPKSEQYWPKKGATRTIEEMKVTTLSQTQISETVIQREIKIDIPTQKESHTLLQLHYTGWPDWGLPKESEGVMHIVSEMVKIRENVDTPIIVHCSAGVGRTGTVIAITLIQEILALQKAQDQELKVSVFQIVSRLREQRVMMVQTPEQYLFVYKMAVQMMEQLEK